jgi:hypothetical protein
VKERLWLLATNHPGGNNPVRKLLTNSLSFFTIDDMNSLRLKNGLPLNAIGLIKQLLLLGAEILQGDLIVPLLLCLRKTRVEIPKSMER